MDKMVDKPVIYKFVTKICEMMIMIMMMICTPAALLHSWCLYVEYRLHSADHNIGKHLLHNGAIPTSSATSAERRKSDQILLYGHSCPDHLANTYRRFAYLGFSTVRIVVSILAVCRYCFSLSAHVRFGFLSDASCRGEVNSSCGVQHCHTVCVHFRLLRELVSRSDTLLVLDVLRANVLWKCTDERARVVVRHYYANSSMVHSARLRMCYCNVSTWSTCTAGVLPLLASQRQGEEQVFRQTNIIWTQWRTPNNRTTKARHSSWSQFKTDDVLRRVMTKDDARWKQRKLMIHRWTVRLSRSCSFLYAYRSIWSML